MPLLPDAIKLIRTFYIGESKEKYEFVVCSKNIKFGDVSAVYIFAEYNPDGKDDNEYLPLYIGESEQLKTRLAEHKRAELIHEDDYTHILIKIVDDKKTNKEKTNERKRIEKDLIRGNWTPHNEQHNYSLDE